MTRMTWTDDLATGIPELDRQHMRLMVLINRLTDVLEKEAPTDAAPPDGCLIAPLFGDGARLRQEVLLVVEDVIDYTLTHFAFEEALMDSADYGYFEAHKKTHDVFRDRIVGIYGRLQGGESAAGELESLLARWLFSHIRHDDGIMAREVSLRLSSSLSPEILRRSAKVPPLVA